MRFERWKLGLQRIYEKKQMIYFFLSLVQTKETRFGKTLWGRHVLVLLGYFEIFLGHFPMTFFFKNKIGINVILLKINNYKIYMGRHYYLGMYKWVVPTRVELNIFGSGPKARSDSRVRVGLLAKAYNNTTRTQFYELIMS